MDYKKHQLPNGLRVITVPFKNLQSATVTIWAGVGSRHETNSESGISHFLEHMVFKGSKKRPTAREIAEAVDAIGGEFNAGTSKEWTNFYIRARGGSIPFAFDVLSDMVLNPILREDDIKREKGVILEEMALYEDTPTARVGDIFEQLIFNGYPLGRDIIGTKESVKSITKSNFKSFREKYYHPRNFLITVSGGIDEAEVLTLVNKYFGDLGQDGKKAESQKFEPQQRSPQVLLKSQKKEQGHFILGYLGHKRGDESRFVESLLAAILGGGMSSRLFSEIREKRGLAYSVRTSVEHYFDTGYFESYAGVEINKIEDAIKIMLDQSYGLRDGKYEITKTELSKAKEYVKGHLALSLEDTRNINHFLGEEELILGSVLTPEEVFKKIDKVTTEDILEVAKRILVPSLANLAIIGPYDNQEKFEKLLK